MKVALVILCKNEIGGLKNVVPRIPRESVDEIIAVDYASTDGSPEFLKEQGIHVLAQTVPGRGEAFRMAVREANADAFIFFSADGNEDPADIPKFRSQFEEGADIVIATRMTHDAHNEEDGEFIRLRKWVNLAFTLIANILWNRSGKYLTDTINGYRGITRNAWETLALDGHGYTIEYQMSIRALQAGMRINEFPTYEAERIGTGGSPALKTGIVFIELLLNEMWRSFKLFLRIGTAYTPHSSQGR